MVLKTTFNEIKSFGPCKDEWDDLLKNCNPELDMQKEIDLMDILESNGIEPAVWALRCFDYKDYCLFLADVAESVLPVFEAEYPGDDRPRKAIEAVRGFHSGKIIAGKLVAAVSDAAWAAMGATGWTPTSAAAWAASWAAEQANVKAAAEVAAWATKYTAKWREIGELFRKHFGEKDDHEKRLT